jgi:hypothetical protein
MEFRTDPLFIHGSLASSPLPFDGAIRFHLVSFVLFLFLLTCVYVMAFLLFYPLFCLTFRYSIDLVDFQRKAKSNTLVGTPYYLSPEAILGMPLNVRA